MRRTEARDPLHPGCVDLCFRRAGAEATPSWLNPRCDIWCSFSPTYPLFSPSSPSCSFLVYILSRHIYRLSGDSSFPKSWLRLFSCASASAVPSIHLIHTGSHASVPQVIRWNNYSRSATSSSSLIESRNESRFLRLQYRSTTHHAPFSSCHYLAAIFSSRDSESLAHWIKETHVPRNLRFHRWDLGTKASSSVESTHTNPIRIYFRFWRGLPSSPLSPLSAFSCTFSCTFCHVHLKHWSSGYLIVAYGEISFISSLAFHLTSPFIYYTATLIVFDCLSSNPCMHILVLF